MRHGINTERQFDSSVTVETSTELSLRELFPVARFIAAQDISFSQLAESPRKCREGELVVYRIGQDDPVRLVADAMACGAVGILTEQLLPCPLPQCIVGDTEIALAKIASAQLERPDRKLLTIGVTGASGKTTTALLISTLLRSCGYRSAYQTDLGDCDGIVQRTSKESVPSNSALVQWLSDAADTGAQAAIIELSDDQIRFGGYDSIEFDLLVVCGGSVPNTDFGPTAIQCAIDCLTDDGIVIVPAEDEKTLRLIRDADAKPLTYSVRKAADATAKIFDQSGGMTTLMVNHQNTTAMMETALCGAANAANHLAATMVGLLLGHQLEQIVESLGGLREVPGRQQRLVEFDQATVVIDAGGSPQRAADSLRTQRSMKAGGRLWCVLAVDGTDAATTLAQYGSLLERFADHAIVTSTSVGKKSFLSASHCVLDGVEECAAMRLVADQKRAIQWALSEANANDTILILTGCQSKSAHQRRCEIEEIKGWIEATRQPNQESENASALKIFQ